MSDFFRTQMGHTFYESTLPNLVTELRRLNDLLERAIDVAERAYAITESKEDKK